MHKSIHSYSLGSAPKSQGARTLSPVSIRCQERIRKGSCPLYVNHIHIRHKIRMNLFELCYLLVRVPSLLIHKIIFQNDQVHIAVTSTHNQAFCPACNKRTDSHHRCAVQQKLAHTPASWYEPSSLPASTLSMSSAPVWLGFMRITGKYTRNQVETASQLACEAELLHYCGVKEVVDSLPPLPPCRHSTVRA